MAKGSYGNPKASSVSLRDKKRSQAMRGQASTSTGTRSAKPQSSKSGTTSYKQAYAKAGGAAKLGDYASWEKKAKAWNQKKYGTTEPTAKAKKMTGGSKQELAKAHSTASKPTQTLKAFNLSGYDPIKVKGGTLKKTDTQTLQNKRMSQAIESARSEESLLDGKDRRRLERKARIQDRVDNRTARRQDRADNRISKIQNRADKKISRITNKSKAKSKSSASSANQDLAMQKINSDVRKYSIK